MAELVQQNPVVPLDIQGIAGNRLILQEGEARARDRQIAEQQAAEQQRILQEVAKIPLVQDPKSGIWGPDENAITQKFGGMVPKPLQESIAAYHTRVKAVHDAQQATLAEDSRRVLIAPSTWADTVKAWEGNHIISKSESENWQKITDPKEITRIAGLLSGQPPEKLMEMDPTKNYGSPTTGQVVVQGTPAASKPANVGTVEAYIRSKYGDTPTPQQMLKGRAEFEAAGRAPTADQQVGPVPVADPNAPHGEDFLKSIDANRAAVIKSLAEGRQPWPSAMAMRTPYWQKIANDVFQYDPTFDTATASNNARVKVRTDFTSGASAKQVNALNTVIGHLGTLTDAAVNLGNSDTQFLNTVKNWFSKQAGGTAVTNFETAKEAVASELVRVWRQAGGSTQDVQDWKKTLDSSQSPAQLRENIATIGHLLESKLSSMQEQLRQGMGIAAIELTTPESRAALDKMEGKKQGQGTAKTGDTVTHAIGGASVVFKRISDGWQAPDGTVYDDKWVRIR